MYCASQRSTPTRDFKISTKDHELCHISDMGQEVTATIMEVKKKKINNPVTHICRRIHSQLRGSDSFRFHLGVIWGGFGFGLGR